MYYYKLEDDNIHIEAYCRDKGHAKKNGFNITTNEEIVMQGDGSGYVLVSKYIAPDTRIDELEKEYNECVSQLKDYMAEAHLLADNELIQDIQNEYAEITKTYDEQTTEILNEV